MKRTGVMLTAGLICFCIFGCSTPPTYTRKDIERVIERICQEEFNYNVKAYAIGQSIWVYAPFEDLINADSQINSQKEITLRNIFLSLRRAVLSMDSPPQFFILVASNVKNIGMDIYYIGFTPDIVKSELQFISRNEFDERIITLPFKNSKALNDYNGSHVPMLDITMGDFITYLVRQKVSKIYSDKSLAPNAHLEAIEGIYEQKRMIIRIELPRDPADTLTPQPLDTIKQVAKEFLTIYEEFSPDITMIEIDDRSGGVKRCYSKMTLFEEK